jgi:hypothetical protein
MNPDTPDLIGEFSDASCRQYPLNWPAGSNSRGDNRIPKNGQQLTQAPLLDRKQSKWLGASQAASPRRRSELAVVAHQACEGPPSALEAHDPAAAERAMRNHVKRSYARFTTYFD